MCFPLYACARKVVSDYTPLLKPLGITYTQYIVFMVLWERDDLSIGEICERLNLDNGTLTPLLKKMESNGFINRTRSKSDERVIRVTLTDKGKELREKAVSVPVSMRQCLHALTDEEIKQMYVLLYKLLNSD
ncbi:transcriptional regulator, MarR family [Thermoplasmatales archaeon BRNA1]|nr:transcriptional regulator, MarR family [Thermoplasmatales archaeon BRNA1]